MNKENIEYYIGIMSGTSMDGIDATCVEFINNKYSKLIAHYYIPYSKKLTKQLLKMQYVKCNELHISQLISNKITKKYIKIVKELLTKCSMSNDEIKAIGCHGQTIRHNPKKGYSIQLANWSMLAEHTRIPVVGEFRQTDIVANGNGAPLVAKFHQELFASDNQNIVVANIGGIANITILEKNNVIGFDTGPGNMLIDYWMQKKFNLMYDDGGKLSSKGKIIPKLLDKLMKTSYLYLPPPKSTGRDLFSWIFLKNKLNNKYNKYNVARTLIEFTALTLTNAIKQYGNNSKKLIICGGGVNNDFLINRIKELLNNVEIIITDELGINHQQIESIAFAFLAMCRIKKLNSNLPLVTGAVGNRVLGAIWHPYTTIN